MKKYDNFCKALENLKEGAKLEEPYSIVEQLLDYFKYALNSLGNL